MKTRTVALALTGLMVLGGASALAIGRDGSEPEVRAGSLLRIITDLNLTGGQKADIAGIIAAEREKNRALLGDLFKARRNLFETIHSESADASEVRAAFRQASAVEEELAVRRAVMTKKFRSVLTAEQKALLSEAKQTLFARVQERLDEACGAVDAWVDSQLAK